MKTLGLKNINLLTQEQYNGIANPAEDELYAIDASGWGMPDYSALISVTYPLSSNPYTAPCDGMLCPWGKPSNTAIRPIINGVIQEYLRVGELSAGSGGYQGRSIYLSKGDVIYFDNPYGTLNGCVFYPLKGAK